MLWLASHTKIQQKWELEIDSNKNCQLIFDKGEKKKLNEGKILLSTNGLEHLYIHVPDRLNNA